MKLYVFPVAPNPTRVRLYVAEKRAQGGRLPLEEVTVDLVKGEQRSPAHRARNPLGSLPVLEMEDGRHIWESLAIIEYLEERFPEPTLLGRDPEARALSRQLERIVDLGVLIPIARVVHATKSPLGLPENPEIARDQRARLEPVLQHLEARLADGRPFLAGDEVTLADCTLAAGLQFGRFLELDFLEHRPGLRAWDDAYRGRGPARSVLTL